MSGLCEECKVPKVFTGEHLWLDNGDIVQKRDQRHRLVFIESENLDPLFQGMEQTIGMPIQNIVINCVRRTLLTYMSLFISDEVREKVHNKEVSLKAMDDGFRDLARPMGSGRYEFVDMRFEGDKDDYFAVSITEPYSLPMCVAGHAAAIEAILGYDHGVTYSEAAPGVYNVTAFPFSHPKEFKGRLDMPYYEHVRGAIELERCATCGGPKALAGYRWYLDRGIIMNISNGRRMALMSPSEMDPVFTELEAELGDTIPRVVVEAQRRFTKTGFYSLFEVKDENDFRVELAVRGLGNLKEINVRRKMGVHMIVENAALPLMLVGMMQGVYESAFDVESHVEWEVSAEGDLSVEITPRTVMVNA